MNAESLTADQRRALDTAQRYPHRSAKGLHCSAAEIRDLEQRGYLERAGVNNGTMFYSITDAGRATLDTLKVMDEAKAQHTDLLTTAEAAQCLNLTARAFLRRLSEYGLKPADSRWTWDGRVEWLYSTADIATLQKWIEGPNQEGKRVTR